MALMACSNVSNQSILSSLSRVDNKRKDETIVATMLMFSVICDSDFVMTLSRNRTTLMEANEILMNGIEFMK